MMMTLTLANHNHNHLKHSLNPVAEYEFRIWIWTSKDQVVKHLTRGWREEMMSYFQMIEMVGLGFSSATWCAPECQRTHTPPAKDAMSRSELDLPCKYNLFIRTSAGTHQPHDSFCTSTSFTAFVLMGYPECLCVIAPPWPATWNALSWMF